jgi:uncharacterized protein (DUF2147 family)
MATDRRRTMRIHLARAGLAIMIVLLPPVTVAAGPGSAIEGQWLTDDGKAVVMIDHCGAALCGRINRVMDRTPGIPTTDVHNPDARLRNRPITGLVILTGFMNERGKWVGGRAYDPKTGNSYRSRLELNADYSLRVTGCVLLFCQSKRWKRIP